MLLRLAVCDEVVFIALTSVFIELTSVRTLCSLLPSPSWRAYRRAHSSFPLLAFFWIGAILYLSFARQDMYDITRSVSQRVILFNIYLQSLNSSFTSLSIRRYHVERAISCDDIRVIFLSWYNKVRVGSAV